MMRMSSALLLLSISLAQGAPLYKARQQGAGYLECPPELRVDSKGKTIFCDLSAAVYGKDRNIIYYAGDWWGGTKHSKLLSMTWRNHLPVQSTRKYYADAPAFIGIEKVEAMTRTEDGRFFIASGAFTHSVDTGYADWMKINSLVYWQDGRVSEAAKPDLLVDTRPIPAASIGEVEYANHLRNGMLEAIQSRYPQSTYFKIEGLSVMPGKRLAFGVREIGRHYTQAVYKSIILTTTYAVKSGRLIIGTDFNLLRDLPLNEKYTLADKVGLSSIEYDFNKQRLYMTTSFERNIGGDGSGSSKDIGAYVWVIPMNKDNGQLKTPRLVRNDASEPYQYAHKAEAMAIDASGRLILIADDDKVLGGATGGVNFPDSQFSRKPWQAAYTVLRIVPGGAASALPH